jgi:hypothetical protein
MNMYSCLPPKKLGLSYEYLMLVTPLCFSNTYKVQNISQNVTIYYIKYNLRRHVSTLFCNLQALKEQIQGNQSL